MPQQPYYDGFSDNVLEMYERYCILRQAGYCFESLIPTDSKYILICIAIYTLYDLVAFNYCFKLVQFNLIV